MEFRLTRLEAMEEYKRMNEERQLCIQARDRLNRKIAALDAEISEHFTKYQLHKDGG